MIELSRDFKPFAKAVVNEASPLDFLDPKIPQFDRTTNPTQHLKKYCAHMIMSGGNDAHHCKFFCGNTNKYHVGLVQWNN